MLMIWLSIALFQSSEALMVPFLYDLWSASAFGRDPNRTETAAWILLDSSGHIEFMRWRRSFARNSELWKGAVPRNVIAQVHTHSVWVDPKPSHCDVALARRLLIPIYTISENGIWKATPFGAIRKVMEPPWLQRQVRKKQIAATD